MQIKRKNAQSMQLKEKKMSPANNELYRRSIEYRRISVCVQLV